MSEKKGNGFETLDSAKKIKNYLCDTMKYIENKSNFHHYTSIQNVISMLKSGYMYLGNPKNMNDQLEYRNGDPEIWSQTYFTSFMAESSESIGMWSMYAQPWTEGVRLSIPKGICKKWIDSTDVLYKVIDKSCTSETVEIAYSTTNWGFESVVYTELDMNGESVNRWNTLTNTLVKNLIEEKSLTGFVKDNAWSYEKEIRLKVTLNEAVNCDKLAIKITDEVINNLIITPSPLFEGEFMDKLEKNIRSKVSQDNLSDSLFKGKLKNVDHCKECAKICKICKTVQKCAKCSKTNNRSG